MPSWVWLSTAMPIARCSSPARAGSATAMPLCWSTRAVCKVRGGLPLVMGARLRGAGARDVAAPGARATVPAIAVALSAGAVLLRAAPVRGVVAVFGYPSGRTGYVQYFWISNVAANKHLDEFGTVKNVALRG